MRFAMAFLSWSFLSWSWSRFGVLKKLTPGGAITHEVSRLQKGFRSCREQTQKFYYRFRRRPAFHGARSRRRSRPLALLSRRRAADVVQNRPFLSARVSAVPQLSL